jgi:aspartate kinase
MRIVQKFGGTSVGSIERIQNVAKRVKGWADNGYEVVVVVSAMSGETNRLTELIKKIDPNANRREQDVVLSSGEQVSMALLSIALQAIGIEAVSFSGWQAGISTDKVHSKARILDINSSRIDAVLKQKKIAVVAGFQGITNEQNISTLGRGGSDTSAVALSIALKADECQIYTDVDGVYSTDPRIVPEARRLNTILFEEMLEMASLGAKVLQIRSVELACKYEVPLRVLSSLTPIDENPSLEKLEGTLIIPENKKQTMTKTMEDPKIAGIAFNRDEAQIKVMGVPDRPGVAYKILSAISEQNIEVDMIVQNTSANKLTDFTYTVNRGDYARALEITEGLLSQIEATGVIGNNKMVKVSLVGVGMRSHAGIASKMFEALAQQGINILIISTSEIKISVGIDEQDLEKAVNILHQKFELEKQPA